jgi:hypothetical protein
LTLEQDIHLDLSVFISRFGVVNIALSVQIGNNHNALLVVIVVQEPSVCVSGFQVLGSWYKPRGLANEQASCGQKKTHDALHEERNSP